MSGPHTPRVSVVIPSYQRCESLRRTLVALTRQTLAPSDYEVVVSLDGSSDGSREMVAAFTAPYALRAVWQPNRGRAGACNAGVHESRGSVVVLLDDDMEPSPQCLAAHAAAHAADPRVGVLGAVPIAVGPCSPPVVVYVGKKFNEHLRRLSRPGARIDVRDFYSGNFSIRRSVLDEVGGYNEAFRDYGNEDGELAIRLLAAGVRLTLSTEALARQHYEKDFAALARDSIAKGRTAVLCAHMHPDAVTQQRLGTYGAASLKWRTLRGLLLRASHVVPALPDHVVRLVRWAERRRPARMPKVYALALDYLFWVGAQSAPAGGLPSVEPVRSAVQLGARATERTVRAPEHSPAEREGTA